MDTLTCLAVRDLPFFMVTFNPRSEYAGKPVIPELLQHAGSVLKVRMLWQMDDGDPYPGEWAVGSATDDPLLLGRSWIASGDLDLFLAPRSPMPLFLAPVAST